MGKSIKKLTSELYSKYNNNWQQLYFKYLNQNGKDGDLDGAILYCYNNLIVDKKSINDCLNELNNG